MLKILQILSMVVLVVGTGVVVVMLFKVSTLVAALSKRLTIEKEKDNL